MRLHRVMDLHRRGVKTFDDRRALGKRRVHAAVLADVRSRGIGRAVPDLRRIFPPRLVFVHDKFMARPGLHLDGAQRIKTRLFAGAGDGGDLLAVITNGERTIARDHGGLDAGNLPRLVQID